jgi:hypothetical protein
MTRKADNFALTGAMLISEEEFYERNSETSAPVVAKHFLVSLQVSPCAMGLAVPVKYTAY